MFTKTLLPDTIRAIKLISNNESVKHAYLAGGTALALQIGHRVSVDLDFFTLNEFDEKKLSSEFSNLKYFKEDGTSWRTVWGKIGETKFSLFYYKYKLLDKTSEFEAIQLASLKDIAAMKIHAIESRGTKRDFVDLYFLSKTFSLDDMLNFYNQKYLDLDEKMYHIIRSLDYFNDAEIDPMPNMLIETSWTQVKKYFQDESKRLAIQNLTK